ncbi:hypothetical protein H6F89_19935 [Cyanobacteria bacterium FACHB-63]|nr:hypothetical protein [Cyanobacteria bacterium FACHB-63]
MLINDLSYLETLGQVPDCSGGVLPFGLLLLSIKDKALVLQYGSKPLFETTLSSTPTQVALTVSGMPVVGVTSRTQNINGNIESFTSIFFGELSPA